MGQITDYMETQLLDHILNDDTWTSPANIYLCLCTADPTDAATGASMSEVANDYSYARTAISFGAAASRKVIQSGAVNFPQASGGSWGTVSHWAICDNITHGSGNVLATGGFAASKPVGDGDTPSVADTEIEIEFTAGEISNFLVLEMLDHAFNNLTYASPQTWIALCEAIVGDGDTGSTITEEGAGAYARVQVNVNGGSSPTWDQAGGTTPTIVDNTHDIPFITATADWGSQVAVAVCTLATLGEVLFYDNDMVDKSVYDGDTAKFPAGDLDITAE